MDKKIEEKTQEWKQLIEDKIEEIKNKSEQIKKDINIFRDTGGLVKQPNR